MDHDRGATNGPRPCCGHRTLTAATGPSCAHTCHVSVEIGTLACAKCGPAVRKELGMPPGAIVNTDTPLQRRVEPHDKALSIEITEVGATRLLYVSLLSIIPAPRRMYATFTLSPASTRGRSAIAAWIWRLPGAMPSPCFSVPPGTELCRASSHSKMEQLWPDPQSSNAPEPSKTL